MRFRTSFKLVLSNWLSCSLDKSRMKPGNDWLFVVAFSLFEYIGCAAWVSWSNGCQSLAVAVARVCLSLFGCLLSFLYSMSSSLSCLFSFSSISPPLVGFFHCFDSSFDRFLHFLHFSFMFCALLVQKLLGVLYAFANSGILRGLFGNGRSRPYVTDWNS